MQQLLDRLRQFRDARDWSQFHTPKDLAISVSVEAGELLELFQWASPGAHVDEDLKSKLSSEAADVFIYLLLLCDSCGVDLQEATWAKIKRNEARFPIDTSRGVAKPVDAKPGE